CSIGGQGRPNGDRRPIPARNRSVAVQGGSRASNRCRCVGEITGGAGKTGPPPGSAKLRPADGPEESKPDARFRRTDRTAAHAGGSQPGVAGSGEPLDRPSDRLSARLAVTAQQDDDRRSDERTSNAPQCRARGNGYPGYVQQGCGNDA